MSDRSLTVSSAAGSAGPDSAATDAAAPESALPIILIYEDMTAALRAVGQLFKLRCQLPGGFEQRLSTWNFSMLGQPDLRPRIAADTAAARLIVLAATSAGQQLPAHVAEWLSEALRQRSEGRPCAVAPLFTHHRTEDGADSPRLRFVQNLAAATGTRLLSPVAPQPVTAVA